MAWGFWARRVLAAFEGTPMLPWYVSAMGSKGGQGAVLGSASRRSSSGQCCTIEDGADRGLPVQAHTFRTASSRSITCTSDATRPVRGLGAAYGRDVGERSTSLPTVCHEARAAACRTQLRWGPTRIYEGCRVPPTPLRQLARVGAVEQLVQRAGACFEAVDDLDAASNVREVPLGELGHGLRNRAA